MKLYLLDTEDKTILSFLAIEGLPGYRRDAKLIVDLTRLKINSILIMQKLDQYLRTIRLLSQRYDNNAINFLKTLPNEKVLKKIFSKIY